MQLVSSNIIPPGIIYTDMVPGRSAVKSERFLSRSKNLSWIVLGICFVIQSIFFLSPPNLFAIACVAFSWKITTHIFLSQRILWKYPLSSFLIIGFVATQFYFPLVFTTVEFKPVIFNLEIPYQVFFHSELAFLVLILSHFLYRAIFRKSTNTVRSILVKAKLFAPPTEMQLWFMGAIGLFATYYVTIYLSSFGPEATLGAGNKFIAGFISFSYAPFLIPFGKLYGSKQKFHKTLIPMLAIFAILLFAISVGRNSRLTFMLGFTSLGFAYGLGLLLGILKTRLLTLRNVFIFILSFWLLTGPVADLGTAMVIVRGQRKDVFGLDFIALTLDAFQDKEEIRKSRLEAKGQTFLSENYLDNILLARFCNLRFNDNSLVAASAVQETDTSMLTFSVDRLWANLPENILNELSALGLKVDKKFVNSQSYGSYLFSVSGDAINETGGFRVGHFAGTGMAAFGWWYLLLLGLLMIPAYVLIDALFKREFVSGLKPGLFPSVRFSLCGLLSLTTVFMFLPAESVIDVLSYIIRNWIQMILLYVLFFHLTRVLTIPFKKSGT